MGGGNIFNIFSFGKMDSVGLQQGVFGTYLLILTGTRKKI
jgi:hypothetical protein